VSSLEELRASRARVVAARLDERRRIERALHDGVQQDLIALAVRLQLLGQELENVPDSVRASLDELRRDVHEALERVQELASDIYPSLLDVRGLPDALRAAAPGLAIDAEGIGRYPASIEATVYFGCDAVLARTDTIRMWADEEALRLEIEGRTEFGAAELEAAREHLDAAGGTLASRGTRLTVTVPLRGPDKLTSPPNPRPGRGARP
jgi:hypothetical protein